MVRIGVFWKSLETVYRGSPSCETVSLHLKPDTDDPRDCSRQSRFNSSRRRSEKTTREKDIPARNTLAVIDPRERFLAFNVSTSLGSRFARSDFKSSRLLSTSGLGSIPARTVTRIVCYRLSAMTFREKSLTNRLIVGETSRNVGREKSVS